MPRPPKVISVDGFRFGIGTFSGSVNVVVRSDGTREALAQQDGLTWCSGVSSQSSQDSAQSLALQACRKHWSEVMNMPLKEDGSLPGIGNAEVREQVDGLGIGEYRRRIFRPGSWRLAAESADERADSRVAARNIEDMLQSIFGIVFPGSESNRKAYGHRIREVLVLAATEVENSWKEVWNTQAKPAKPAKPGHLTTKDYVKLKGPLGLNKFVLSLPDFPTIPQIAPFATWSREKSTKSLDWYNAYNSTKHDRRAAFEDGNLNMALAAVAGVWALHGAQFGPTTIDEDSRVFRLVKPIQYHFREGYVAPLVELPSYPLQPSPLVL